MKQNEMVLGCPSGLTCWFIPYNLQHFNQHFDPYLYRWHFSAYISCPRVRGSFINSFLVININLSDGSLQYKIFCTCRPTREDPNCNAANVLGMSTSAVAVMVTFFRICVRKKCVTIGDSRNIIMSGRTPSIEHGGEYVPNQTLSCARVYRHIVRQFSLYNQMNMLHYPINPIHKPKKCKSAQSYSD